MSTSAIPILYSFRRCPYAMRARLALAISGQSCELREVVLRDKPAEMLAASPKATVPVLIDPDGRVLEESLDIMLWSLRRNDPERWLAPEAGTLDEMLALIARFDGDFKFHLDRYKYPERYPATDALTHRAAGALLLEELAARLDSAPFLFGDRRALADMAIAPFVRQFVIADPAWFNAQPWPRLQSWLASVLDSALYASIMEKYPKWESGTSGIPFPAH